MIQLLFRTTRTLFAFCLLAAFPAATWAHALESGASGIRAQQPDSEATDKQSEEAQSSNDETDEGAEKSAKDQGALRFLEAVTVTATRSPSVVKDTPGTVSVITDEAIERLMTEELSDLLDFEPGVYVESNITRVGANGFNIRGIGGNRVMTQVDGVETSEQFDFGPFNVHQFALDLDTLKSVELVRSAGSSLYGSDALGGVVSFFTKDPADYLAGKKFHTAAKLTFDGRTDMASGNAVIAGGSERVEASLFISVASGNEPDNRGDIETEDSTRTLPNPQDRRNVQTVGKLVFRPKDGHILRGTFELTDSRVETNAFSSRSSFSFGPTTTNVEDVHAADEMRRLRLSVDHTLDNMAGMDSWMWRLYGQQSDTDQVVDESRTSIGPRGSVSFERNGILTYEQQTYGGELQGRKALLLGEQSMLMIFGGTYKRDNFDMLRDRADTEVGTGAPVPTSSIFPSKYFPKSAVSESGAYLHTDLQLGRLRVFPGARFDHFSLDADSNDPIFLASLSPPAEDFSAGRLTGKLGASVDVGGGVTLHTQYAGGFRAPPYSSVNSGFTNLLGGYTTISNPGLDPETSNNFETGLRLVNGPLLFSVTGFWNEYNNFILLNRRGSSPTGLLQFQYQNISEARIRGLELQAEVQLSDSWRIRSAYAAIAGDDTSEDEEVPLEAIAPNQGTLGIGFIEPSNRFGSDLIARVVGGQSLEAVEEDNFAPESYAVLDLTAWVHLGSDVILRVGVLNLTDQKYFEWANVRGRLADDPAIDRYSNPGINVVTSLSVGW